MSDLTNTDNTDDVTDVDTTDNEWAPPTKEEWDDLLARKSRADSEAASRKRWLRDLGYDPKTGQKVTDGSVADAGTQGAAQGQEPAAKPVQVDAAAIETAVSSKIEAVYTALAEAGVGPKSLARVSKLVDKSSITIDEDGIEGLSNQVEALKSEFPELFKRARTTSVADASAVGAGKKVTPDANQSNDWQDKIRERFNKGRI